MFLGDGKFIEMENFICVCSIFSSFTHFVNRNPSSGSMSETGSLDRMKAAAERRKKGLDEGGPTVSGRVEGTRVNPDSLIDEILKNTKLDQLEESAESKNYFMEKVNRFSNFRFLNQLKRLDCNCTLLEMVQLHLVKVQKLNLVWREVSSNKL